MSWQNLDSQNHYLKEHVISRQRAGVANRGMRSCRWSSISIILSTTTATGRGISRHFGALSRGFQSSKTTYKGPDRQEDYQYSSSCRRDLLHATVSAYVNEILLVLIDTIKSLMYLLEDQQREWRLTFRPTTKDREMLTYSVHLRMGTLIILNNYLPADHHAFSALQMPMGDAWTCCLHGDPMRPGCRINKWMLGLTRSSSNRRSILKRQAENVSIPGWR